MSRLVARAAVRRLLVVAALLTGVALLRRRLLDLLTRTTGTWIGRSR